LNRNTQVPFVLEGQWGVLEYMAQRLKKNGICVVVIAEGAGQVENIQIFK
jgi:6-phosphofructokinase 1